MNIEQLARHLQDWNNRDCGPDASHELALSILESCEQLVAHGSAGQAETAALHDCLNTTGRSDFLVALDDRALRYRWAEWTARAVELSQYSLLDMFRYRVDTSPRGTLLRDMSGQQPTNWSYQLVDQRTRALAAGLFKINRNPRVAILSDNCVESAFADLACLFYNILVTPLNVHFDPEVLAYILDRLEINMVLTDTADHRDRLLEARAKAGSPFAIYALRAEAEKKDEVANIFRDVSFRLSSDEIESCVGDCSRNSLDQVNTVMFTSGSTGMPKGISFSEYNLVTKRFARAAALPEVGEREVLLCYLPLYHTFGRFFELLGTIYWGGTYVFPGNTSSGTFLDLLPTVRPSGLIGVPLRWQLIQDRCLERMSTVAGADQKEEEFRRVVGNRLKWGLSAAGYLPPSVFRFFHNNGVKLCSGFGMTEATGGIMMTPPEEYVDNSIGIPLPLLDARLSAEGELEISGDYIAHYLDDCGPGDAIPITQSPEQRYWLQTGDLFKQLPGGHYQIIDRLKDIYKNSRGQTISPQRVESKFENVPGIKRTFLVGDARDFNNLLIVPDTDDPVYRNLVTDDDKREYYHQIVSSANRDLAAYERVVNFAVVDRDFSLNKGELTPKGSLKRKAIEKNFEETIAGLYESNVVTLGYDGLRMVLPRWVFRDLGLLEDSLRFVADGLVDSENRVLLRIARTGTDDRIQIGDLVYEVTGSTVDLGVLVRQPRLWAGNMSVMRFYPCKAGWDTSYGAFTGRMALPADLSDRTWEVPEVDSVVKDRGDKLTAISNLVAVALFGKIKHAQLAIEALAVKLKETDEQLSALIRKRLVLLAYHPEFALRSLAYRVLLLDEPTAGYEDSLPAFIESGLSFLDEDSIAKLAHSDLNIVRLASLRKRLFHYRTTMTWPVSGTVRKQFEHVLTLLADFAGLHPKYYDTVRCELASWVLHRDDPELASRATALLDRVIDKYEAGLLQNTRRYSKQQWQEKIIFADELTTAERDRILEVISQPTFLKQSVILAFDLDDFDLSDVQPGGIWISRITSRRHYLRYRVSINTNSSKHFDLQMILNDDIKNARVMETIYWLLAISKHPHEFEVLPRLGCCRPEVGARTLVYYGQLTVWEKIREYSERRRNSSSKSNQAAWRKLILRGLTAVFRVWRISGKRIIPGAISPENLVVPHLDFARRATVLSLTGYREYDGPLSLVRPIVQQIFHRTIAHYPWCRYLMDINWVFDACIEELGVDNGRAFLLELRSQLETDSVSYDGTPLSEYLDAYLNRLENEMYLPLPLRNAISRYQEWTTVSPDATPQAREQIIRELLRLYGLDKYPEIIRYYLYFETYFSHASHETRSAYKKLLDRMHLESTKPATQLIELSELQATLMDEGDRILFSGIVFPGAREARQLEVVAVGESDHKHVMVKTTIEDKRHEKYTIAEPKNPAEVGQLYRLFFTQGYHKTISERDRFLVMYDSQDQIVGGLCYRYDLADVVHLDGMIVATTLLGNGIGSVLLEDFCARMEEVGVRLVKTHFYLRKFYTKRGFKVDNRWGALVRFLDH